MRTTELMLAKDMFHHGDVWIIANPGDKPTILLTFVQDQPEGVVLLGTETTQKEQARTRDE